MSTSLLYHGFGIRDYRHLKTEYQHGTIVFHIEKKDSRRYCKLCLSRDVIKFGRVSRRLRTVPIGAKKVFLEVHLHRLKCKNCGRIALEPLEIAYPKKSWTKALGRYVVELLKHTTVKDVAEHLGMSWDTVKDIHEQDLEKKLKRRSLKGLRYIGIDEISVGKGHKYLTIVVDLESGEVVWVGDGRDSQSLEDFFKRLKRSKAQIKAVAMDMWPAYVSAVLKYFPSEVIVYDKYHIIADCNRMLDELRRKEARQASLIEKKIFLGTRYLLLKGQEKIKDKKEAKEKLERLLKLNKPLNTAYLLKEELRQLWACEDREKAKGYLENWLSKAFASGIRLVIRFAKKVSKFKNQILNWFGKPVTTAVVEGINNKIKVLKRQAYGFRDMRYFKLRIYFIRSATYALFG